MDAQNERELATMEVETPNRLASLLSELGLPAHGTRGGWSGEPGNIQAVRLIPLSALNHINLIDIPGVVVEIDVVEMQTRGAKIQ